VPRLEDSSLSELVDELRDEQRRRWLEGDRVDAETVLERNPGVSDDAEHMTNMEIDADGGIQSLEAARWQELASGTPIRSCEGFLPTRSFLRSCLDLQKAVGPGFSILKLLGRFRGYNLIVWLARRNSHLVAGGL
jgi:hypothetical protein